MATYHNFYTIIDNFKNSGTIDHSFSFPRYAVIKTLIYVIENYVFLKILLPLLFFFQESNTKKLPFFSWQLDFS